MGEFAAFDYILRSCAGILNEKINDCFAASLSQEEKNTLSALVSYPERVLEQVNKEKEWYKTYDFSTLNTIEFCSS